ncbi:hypothetical protein SDRG_02434 [Saprolegnia diclina VS20]|uniref:Uncharacterized protein n=1 Tax=Saprolegnia diclina (strain VS20) TaxID=1156394 RepID=T0QR00_SAPDV|nr:hypothetical protein SDRG_02434 [Saprolegnia diclina VS20]EQC40544.1 hypothetical protein SDRG_02434 [Saprolegnia diclina VS20]|eukprot:XP_008606243.1 hypothetical protein SDRG_02434 [Saprolegnia diclina VS20]
MTSATRLRLVGSCGLPLHDKFKAQSVTLELPPGRALGLVLAAPTSGIIAHGLVILDVSNSHLVGHVAPSDRLVAIGGCPVDGLGFAAASERLGLLPRPLALTFESTIIGRELARLAPPQSKREPPSYAVVVDAGVHWTAGSHGAVVNRLTGQAKADGIISVGDVLYKVHETIVLHRSYEAVMSLLRRAPSPCTLHFVPHAHIHALDALAALAAPALPSLEPRLTEASTSNSDEAARRKSDDVGVLKQGPLHQQSGLFKRWTPVHVVLTPTALRCFQHHTSNSPRAELVFVGHRCTVQRLPATGTLYPFVVRVGAKQLQLACAEDDERRSWMRMLQQAMVDAGFAARPSAALGTANDLPGPPSALRVTVLSATNLLPAGQTVHAVCRLSLQTQTFSTKVVRGDRSPMWYQDNVTTFHDVEPDGVLGVCVFDDRRGRPPRLLSTLQVPLSTLPQQRKTVCAYDLVGATIGTKLTLAYEYLSSP